MKPKDLVALSIFFVVTAIGFAAWYFAWAIAAGDMAYFSTEKGFADQGFGPPTTAEKILAQRKIPETAITGISLSLVAAIAAFTASKRRRKTITLGCAQPHSDQGSTN